MADSFPAALENALKGIQTPVQAIAQTTSNISAGVANVTQSLAEIAQGIQNLSNNNASQGNNQASSGGNQTSESPNRLQALGQSSVQLAEKIKNTAVSAANSFKSVFIDPAVKLEQYQFQLEAVEGSSEKAKKSMEWLSNYSIKSPINADAINDAFLKLRSKGIDPTNGLMKTLSDTSLSTGTNLSRTADAFNNAIKGDASALDSLGVSSSTEGQTITYEYTTKENEKKTVQVNKNDTTQIQQTLAQILDDKYSGSTERFSQTWAGMITNLSNHFANFKNMLMGAGVFDFIKEKLGEFQAKVAKLAASGELKKFIDNFANGLIEGMKILWSMGTAFAAVVSTILQGANTVAQAVGGWEVVFKGLAFLMAGSMVISAVSFSISMIQAGKSAYTTATGGLSLATRKLKVLNRALRMSSKRSLRDFTNTMDRASQASENLAKKNKKIKSPKLYIASKFGKGWMAAKRGVDGFSASLGKLRKQKQPKPPPTTKIGKAFAKLSGFARGYLKLSFLPIRAMFLGIKLAMGALLSPLGLIVGAFVLAGALIYKFWEPIKAFMGGVIDGFISGIQPIIDAFKPLQPVFDIIGQGLSLVGDMFSSLFTPMQASSEGLKGVASVGKVVGEILAFAFRLILLPLTLLMNGIGWIIENFGKIVDVVTTAIGSIVSAAKTVGSTLGLVFDVVLSPINMLVKSISWIIENFDKIANFGSSVANKVGKTWDNFKKGGASVLGSLFGIGKQEITANTKLNKSVKQTAEIIDFPNQDKIETGPTAARQGNFPPINTKPTQTNNSTVNAHITVNAAKGMDEVMVAELVKKSVTEMDKQKVVEQRSSLSNYQEYAIA